MVATALVNSGPTCLSNLYFSYCYRQIEENYIVTVILKKKIVNDKLNRSTWYSILILIYSLLRFQTFYIKIWILGEKDILHILHLIVSLMQNVKLYVCERTFSTNVAFIGLKLLLPLIVTLKLLLWDKNV
jgi:hypothetical protein